MKKALISICILFHTVAGSAQYKPSLTAIQDSINNQLKIFPQEKIHLHTDRDYYIPGEKIWFKAYITDAITHQYPTHSRYVYAELINSTDSLISRVMIRPDEHGLYHGHLFLSEVVPEGYYTLRAYTRYLANTHADYFFRKNIRIGKLAEETELQKAKRTQKKQSKIDYEVSFFPEGGYILHGSFCKVAFKALNKNGTSACITGDIVDERDSVITSVNTFHAGMGSFYFFPEQNKKYFLKSKDIHGSAKRFELPTPVNSDAYLVNVSSNHKMHFISIKKSSGAADKPLYVLIHCRGTAQYFASWDYKKGHIAFSKDKLPSGILQIVLFDPDMNPLSERLIFNKNEYFDQPKTVFTTDKASYQQREKVTAYISFPNEDPTLLKGNLSVAITDEKDITADTLNTILSSLLLSSELKGYIEYPGYYLQNNKKAEAALDLLMMTHGWRRYAIPEVIKGNLSYPEKPFEVSTTFSGKVKSLFLGKPIEKSEVTLLSSIGFFDQTETNENGEFRFAAFELPDSTTYFIQSLGKKGSSRVELLMDESPFPLLKYAPYTPVSAFQEKDAVETEEKAKDDFIKKAAQRAKYDESIRIIHLNEVEVTAKRIEKKDEARLKFWGNSSSDHTIYREKIEQRNPMYVSDMLTNVAGVVVSANGAISIRRGGLPLILIDGVPMEWPDELLSKYDSPLEHIPVNAIESIDVFKGPGAAVFGMRGANGAISITTRRGENTYNNGKSFNYVSLSPLGYQKPVEFYSPQYETAGSKHAGNPDYRTTIFWKPDIIITEDSRSSFEFYTSDFPTTYSVVIEGLLSDGKIVRQVEKIEVK